ncbi:tail completion [Aeromonas phage ZPAH14]|uniref:Phage neck terminator protein gp12-like domain-containing protein n=1 Tax=Aeromonas phage ZPAH14 TaxID=2924887 RepID=A0AAE9KJE5_9CAUD|nr:tail completion [Aeromonas phage ZPAH14]UOT58041.1 hypothetical protein [Aeromonas phage ZPAH14]
MEADDTPKMMKLVDLAIGQHRYTYEMKRNQPKPVGQFAGVLLLDEVNPGRDRNEVVPKADGTGFINRTTGVRLVTFQVLFTEGIPACSRFISSFTRQDVQDFMVREDLAVLRHKRVDNKTLTLETNWEIRESVLVECMVRRTFDTDIEVIEAVEAEGIYNEGPKKVDIEIKVNVKEP